MSLQPEPTLHPVQRVQPPWPLKAESYLLFLKMKELPKGLYDSLEKVWEGSEFGRFEGGLGAIMIVRYWDTPVGPYDELMLVPGNFSVPQPKSKPPKIPKSALRIARIYVSQRDTTYNGRLNWNIPKHLARFSFSAPIVPSGSSPPSSLTVRVFPPGSTDGDGAPPFFACTLMPWRWVPRLPVNSSYVPLSLMLVQPPCPEPVGRRTAAAFEAELAEPIDSYATSLKNEEALLVGTERWCGIDVKASGWGRGCWVEILPDEGEEGEGGEGRWWPKGVKSWSVGAWMEDGLFDFEMPLEWKL